MFSFGLSQALEELLDEFQGCEVVGKSIKAENPPSVGTLCSLTHSCHCLEYSLSSRAYCLTKIVRAFFMLTLLIYFIDAF